MPSGSSGSPAGTPSSRFHEEQVLQPARRRWIVALPPATLTALAAGQMRLGHPLTTYLPSTGRLMFLAVLLWAVYVWLSRVRLVTDVDETGISMRLRGLSSHHRIPLDTIKAASIVTVDPDKDFGGYGIRTVDGGRAYMARAARGVRLELEGGRFAVIASGRPGALIDSMAIPARAAAESVRK